jgi:hypothetical protein
LSRFLHRPVVAVLFHVDEVDHDQTGQIAQPQLACDLFRGLQICVQCGLFNGVLARRTAGVDVDRNQGFCLIDDDISAGLQVT